MPSALSPSVRHTAKNDVNILDISQSVLSDLFAMVMLVDITQCKVGLAELADTLSERGHALGLTIHTMHEDIFNSMHRI